MTSPTREKMKDESGDVLLALAERVEGGEFGFYTNKAILQALGYTWRGMAYWFHDNSHTWDKLSDFTGSIDAAVTLVPADLSWEVRQSGFGDPGQAAVWDPMKRPRNNDVRITINRPASAALALCAAALRARASLAKART